MSFSFLRDFETVVSIYASSGYAPSIKSLQTLLARAVLDCSPYIDAEQYPRREPIPEPASEVE